MLASKTVRDSDFMAMIKSATTALKCNGVCVDQCLVRMWTIDEKAECLAICGCYDPP